MHQPTNELLTVLCARLVCRPLTCLEATGSTAIVQGLLAPADVCLVAGGIVTSTLVDCSQSAAEQSAKGSGTCSIITNQPFSGFLVYTYLGNGNAPTGVSVAGQNTVIRTLALTPKSVAPYRFGVVFSEVRQSASVLGALMHHCKHIIATTSCTGHLIKTSCQLSFLHVFYCKRVRCSLSGARAQPSPKTLSQAIHGAFHHYYTSIECAPA